MTPAKRPRAPSSSDWVLEPKVYGFQEMPIEVLPSSSTRRGTVLRAPSPSTSTTGTTPQAPPNAAPRPPSLSPTEHLLPLDAPPATLKSHSTHSASSSPPDFLPHLTHFLLSLHPSLPSIAPLLLGAGVSDVERLTQFVALSDTTREKLLLRAKVGPMQRGMIKGRVNGAREKGWRVEGK